MQPPTAELCGRRGGDEKPLIVILAAAGIAFPDETASSARVGSYARGLEAAGIEVRILCLSSNEPHSRSSLGQAASGEWQGIRFEYTGRDLVRSDSRMLRRIALARGMLDAACRLRKWSQSRTIQAVLLYSVSTIDAAFFRLVTRRLGILYLVDVCETPLLRFPSGPTAALRRALYDRLFFRCFDGYLVISRKLRDYLAPLVGDHARLLLTPIMVDTGAYGTVGPSREGGRHVTYCGLLNDVKDGVGALVRAFASLSAEVPDVDLVLVGDYYTGTRVRHYQTLAADLGVIDRVTLAGAVAHHEVPGYLSRASVLVLARPDTPQTRAGFPTKLGEYLASGRPVVVTRTGEIEDYLVDEVSAFLVEPGDESALKATIMKVLGNPDTAEEVGRRGRLVATAKFDERVVGARLVDFIGRSQHLRKGKPTRPRLAGTQHAKPGRWGHQDCRARNGDDV